MLRGLALTIALITGSTVLAAPNPQLANGVAYKAAKFGIYVDPLELTTAQASALHILFISERGYRKVRRRAISILQNPDFRD